ncbi:MAG: hypothetical protein KDC87_19150, partial [Planctomycetes bacterium]|nr:hypothetical protein [Planctomycetota bacterium]
MIPQPIDPHKIERARTERFDCWFASGWRTAVEPLLDRDPEHWAEWQQVKHSTVRTIYRGELDDGHGGRVPVHLKLFRAVRLSDRARDALGGSRSTREFANLLGAIGRGIRCVEPVAAGTLVGTLGSRSFLLTRTCPGRAMPRHGFSATDAAAAGALLRCAHDAGLHARDLHPGNLLVHPDGGAVLLDLTSALLAEPLDSAHRARALAFFCLDLDGNLRDRTAQQLRARYGAPPELVAAAVQIGRRLRARALESFGRRAFRNCRSTAIERAPRQPRIYLHTGARDLWDDARAALAALDGWTPLKSGRRGAVYLEGNLAVKARTAADARRLFRAAYWLQFAGVPAATPVALWTFQRRGAAAARRLPF